MEIHMQKPPRVILVVHCHEAVRNVYEKNPLLAICDMAEDAASALVKNAVFLGNQLRVLLEGHPFDVEIFRSRLETTDFIVKRDNLSLIELHPLNVAA